ncbi:ImmA/IrrE family metallo-endopeptidase [Brucella intermedia]|uniref:ImmA/IrrE family metallo-endopeptidase n=1 Tax=Brucella intermedia TaxID=94625 RepID=UPI001590846E|nr:ImmA/IrrE family metallo-endopeptidase [Brucella intermedia]
MAIIRRKKNPEAVLRRAHLGNVDNPLELVSLAKKNGLQTQPLDVDGLLKVLGLAVEYSSDLPSDVSGKLQKKDEGWICIVNKNHHPTRQRFTLAHELGHYVLHRNQNTDFVDHTYFRKADNINSMEFEANQFAGEILMPKETFSYFLKFVSSDINKVAEAFGVSPLAASVRAKQLRLVGGGVK